MRYVRGLNDIIEDTEALEKFENGHILIKKGFIDEIVKDIKQVFDVHGNCDMKKVSMPGVSREEIFNVLHELGFGLSKESYREASSTNMLKYDKKSGALSLISGSVIQWATELGQLIHVDLDSFDMYLKIDYIEGEARIDHYLRSSLEESLGIEIPLTLDIVRVAYLCGDMPEKIYLSFGEVEHFPLRIYNILSAKGLEDSRKIRKEAYLLGVDLEIFMLESFEVRKLV